MAARIKLTEEMFAEACHMPCPGIEYDMPPFERCWLVAKKYIEAGVGGDMDNWFVWVFYSLIRQLLWKYEKRPRMQYHTYTLNSDIKTSILEIAFKAPRMIRGEIRIAAFGVINFSLNEEQIASGFATIGPMFEEIAWRINAGECDVYTSAPGPQARLSDSMEGRDN
jgi:hypothetical protein